MQVYGVGVALKILFSDDSSENIQNLQRNELIVCIQTFYSFFRFHSNNSERSSFYSCQYFFLDSCERIRQISK